MNNKKPNNRSSLLKTIEDLIRQPRAEAENIIQISYHQVVNGENYMCNVRHAGL